MLIHFKFGKLFKNKILYQGSFILRLSSLKVQNIMSDTSMLTIFLKLIISDTLQIQVLRLNIILYLK